MHGRDRSELTLVSCAERRVRVRLSRVLRAVGIPVAAGQADSQAVYSCIAALEVNVLNCR